MNVTTNLITLTGKPTGKTRDKIAKADINGKSIKTLLTKRRRKREKKRDYYRPSQVSCLNSK